MNRPGSGRDVHINKITLSLVKGGQWRPPDRGSTSNDLSPLNEDPNEPSREQELQAEVRRLRDEKSDLTGRIDTLQRQLFEIQETGNGSKTGGNTHGNATNNGPNILVVHNELKLTKQKLEILQSERTQLLEQNTQLKATLEYKQSEVRQVMEEFDSRTKDISKDVQQLTHEKHEIVKEKDRLEMELQKSKTTLEELQNQLHLRNRKNSKLENRLKEVENQLFLYATSQSLSVGTSGRQVISENNPDVCGVYSSTITSGYESVDIGARHTGYDEIKYHDTTMAETVEVSSRIDDQSKFSTLPGQQHVHQHRRSLSAFDTKDISKSTYTSYFEGNPTRSMMRTDSTNVINDSNDCQAIIRSEAQNRGRPSGSRFRLSRWFRNRKSMDINLTRESELLTSATKWSFQEAPFITPPAVGYSSKSEEINTHSQEETILTDARQLPIKEWNIHHILAWLRLELEFYSYLNAFGAPVINGKALLNLTDSDFTSVLGITNYFHKLKLRLAIQEYRSPEQCQYPHLRQLTSNWVAGQFLPSLGLPQYSAVFRDSLIDGRVLNQITSSQLDRPELGVSKKLHRVSILKGVAILKYFKFDVQALEDRRYECEGRTDLLVWTNDMIIDWLETTGMGLSEYTLGLDKSGLHGALAVLHSSFNAESLTKLLGRSVKGNKVIANHIHTNFTPLLGAARSAWAKSGKSERPRGWSVGRAFSRTRRASGSSTGRNVEKRQPFKGSVTKLFTSRELKQQEPQNGIVEYRSRQESRLPRNRDNNCQRPQLNANTTSSDTNPLISLCVGSPQEFARDSIPYTVNMPENNSTSAGLTEQYVFESAPCTNQNQRSYKSPDTVNMADTVKLKESINITNQHRTMQLHQPTRQHEHQVQDRHQYHLKQNDVEQHKLQHQKQHQNQQFVEEISQQRLERQQHHSQQYSQTTQHQPQQQHQEREEKHQHQGQQPQMDQILEQKYPHRHEEKQLNTTTENNYVPINGTSSQDDTLYNPQAYLALGSNETPRHPHQPIYAQISKISPKTNFDHYDSQFGKTDIGATSISNELRKTEDISEMQSRSGTVCNKFLTQNEPMITKPSRKGLSTEERKRMFMNDPIYANVDETRNMTSFLAISVEQTNGIRFIDENIQPPNKLNAVARNAVNIRSENTQVNQSTKSCSQTEYSQNLPSDTGNIATQADDKTNYSVIFGPKGSATNLSRRNSLDPVKTVTVQRSASSVSTRREEEVESSERRSWSSMEPSKPHQPISQSIKSNRSAFTKYLQVQNPTFSAMTNKNPVTRAEKPEEKNGTKRYTSANESKRDGADDNGVRNSTEFPVMRSFSFAQGQRNRTSGVVYNHYRDQQQILAQRQNKTDHVATLRSEDVSPTQLSCTKLSDNAPDLLPRDNVMSKIKTHEETKGIVT